MLRVTALSAWLIMVVACSGCATSPAVVTAEEAKTALTFIKANDGKDGYEQLYAAADKLLYESQDDQTYVRKACLIPDPPDIGTANVSVGEGIIGVFIGGLMKLFVGSIQESLEKMIAEYSAAYSASKVVDFYHPEAAGHEANIRTPYRCFRFVRALEDPDKTQSPRKEQAVVDFVGMIEIADDQTGFVIKPLRLYVSEVRAKTSKDDDGNYKHGFAVGITAKSTWRQGNTGRAGEVFSAILASEEIQVLPGKPYLKYFEKPAADAKPKPAELALRTPIIPYSVGSPVPSKDRGRAAFEVRVAETGTPPKGLLFFSKLFAKSSDDLAVLLAASINTRLGFAEED